jgi:hypothetical protein
MDPRHWHANRRPRPQPWMVAAATAIICVAIAIPVHGDAGGADGAVVPPPQAQPQPSGPTSQGDTGAVRGEWRSREQFEEQPRAAVVVREEAGTLAGTLTLLGMTRGADDRATLRVTFRGAKWDGVTLGFETELGSEGRTRWALRLTPAGDATLRPTTDDGKPIEDGPTWEMSRR